MEQSKGWNFNYTTRDIVFIAVLSVISGIINTGANQLWTVTNASAGPLGGAPLQGFFMWGYILTMWLIRKPGAALAVGVFETLVETLLGSTTGIATVGWGVAQGLAIEAVMAISNYQWYSIWHAIAAGAASSQFGTIWTAILFGWDPATANSVWLAVPINLIAGAILSGLLGYFLAQAVGRTGLIRPAEVSS